MERKESSILVMESTGPTLLLSAYTCDPNKGSEAGNGFNWALKLSQLGYNCVCMTNYMGKASLEVYPNIPKNLTFNVVSLPFGLDKVYKWTTAGMYLHYFLWQWFAYKKALKLHKRFKFHLAHHITWGSLQQGSFLYKLPIPFLFGPAGGGQNSHKALQPFFGEAWKQEEKRKKVSDFMLKYNPACKGTLKNARTIFTSNKVTFDLARKMMAKQVVLELDVGLPKHFYPKDLSFKQFKSDTLRLLWVGRFMPRKGISLLLAIMEQLKDYPKISITVVGDGEQSDILKNGIDAHGLTNIDWVGKVPFAQVKEYYATHDAFLFTSLRDSVGVQLAEAMAYGLPVVALGQNGADIMIKETRGISITLTSKEQIISDFVNAILKLYNNPDLLKAMSKNAFDYSKEFIWEDKIRTLVNNHYPNSHTYNN